jgi:hypothetical protein
MIELRTAGERDTAAVADSVITTHVSCCNFVITSIIEAKTSMGASIRSIPDAIAYDRRLHSVLGCIPPDEFEATYYAQPAELQPEPPPA